MYAKPFLKLPSMKNYFFRFYYFDFVICVCVCVYIVQLYNNNCYTNEL